ncbi:hypothetical protein DFH09DRAFT_1080484 [Mycena vulgaris]|nr:hypothetical protein DFH09DRAFT_1080484 [Mycena vulgaris]
MSTTPKWDRDDDARNFSPTPTSAKAEFFGNIHAPKSLRWRWISASGQSIAFFISNDDSTSDAEQEDEGGMDDQQDAASGDDMNSQHDAASGNEDGQQAGNWDSMEAFAAEYDIDMHRLDDEREIFGDGDNSDSD